jgi:hypothetical protein
MGPIFFGIFSQGDLFYPDSFCAKKKDQLTLALPKLLLYRRIYFFFFLVDFFVVFLAAFLVAFFAFFLAMGCSFEVSYFYKHRCCCCWTLQSPLIKLLTN